MVLSEDFGEELKSFVLFIEDNMITNAKIITIANIPNKINGGSILWGVDGCWKLCFFNTDIFLSKHTTTVTTIM